MTLDVVMRKVLNEASATQERLIGPPPPHFHLFDGVGQLRCLPHTQNILNSEGECKNEAARIAKQYVSPDENAERIIMLDLK
jgi:hypothetical protein